MIARMSPTLSLVRLAAGLLASFFVGAFAAPAGAHGPTVEITAEGLRPPLLNLYLGTTVHFAQTIATPEGVSVEIELEGETTKGPVLAAPGDGWHYTFEQPGRHAIRLAERPAATMTIVVVPRRAP